MGEGFPHWKTGAGQPGLGRLAPEARSGWGRRNHQTGSPNGATNRGRQAEPSDGGGGFGPVGAGVFAQRVRQRDKVQIQRIREAGHRHAERGAGEAAGDAPRDQRGYEDGAVFEGDRHVLPAGVTGAAQLRGQDGGERLVAAYAGHGDACQRHGPERPDALRQTPYEAAETAQEVGRVENARIGRRQQDDARHLKHGPDAASGEYFRSGRGGVAEGEAGEQFPGLHALYGQADGAPREDAPEHGLFHVDAEQAQDDDTGGGETEGEEV